MNAPWIQEHVAQELVWIWMAPTGVSAQLATISMRRPVKVRRPGVSPPCVIINKHKTWQMKIVIFDVRKHLRTRNAPTHTHTHTDVYASTNTSSDQLCSVFTSFFSPIALLLQTTPLPPFTLGSGLEPEHLDCLYSGADEEIFGRLQHIPALRSVPGSREERCYILSISNSSSWSLWWGNMRHYFRQNACINYPLVRLHSALSHVDRPWRAAVTSSEAARHAGVLIVQIGF